jgi:hypothetical protein
MSWTGNCRCGPKVRTILVTFLLLFATAFARAQQASLAELTEKFQKGRADFPGEDRIRAFKDLLELMSPEARGPLLLKTHQALVGEWDRLNLRVETSERELIETEKRFEGLRGERRDSMLTEFREARFDFEVRLRHRFSLEGELALAAKGIQEDTARLEGVSRQSRVKELIPRAKRAQGPGSVSNYTQLLAPINDE